MARPLGGDGKPVIGSITAASAASFGRRLAGCVSNWPEVLVRLVLASLGVKARGDIRTEFRNGVTIVSPPSRPAWWPAFEMFVEDVYHLGELDDLELDSGDVVLDLGAHIGTSAVLFGLRWPAATVVCVEPNPVSITYLRRNLEHNHVRSVVHGQAVGAVEGTTTLFGVDSASCAASTSFAVPGARRDVPVVTFDRLVAGAPGRVRVVKLDCEGAEHDVLASASPQAWRHVEAVLLEYHRTDDPASGWPGAEARLNELGLEARWHMAFDWCPGLGMAGFRRRRRVPAGGALRGPAG